MKRLLTIQDISCVGQCSTTVALPLVSACGVECAILPCAVLSNHTGGFPSWTFADLTPELSNVERKWIELGIKFDAFYTGYVCESQIDPILSIFSSCANDGALRIVDPAMADNGKLYPGFDAAYVEEMKRLAFCADVILPNITEAAFLTGTEYRAEYDEAYIDGLLAALKRNGARRVVLTGVGYEENSTGVVVYDGTQKQYYRHIRYARGSHGTGDVYASAFVGALMRGRSDYEAAVIAADYTVRCIETTAALPDHWYGVAFEPVLGELIARLDK